MGSWVSSDLAQYFPQARRKKVTLPLQTLEGSSEFRTYQHQIKINTSQGQRSIKVYESPSIGSVSYPPSFHQKLEKAFNLPFHLPQGEVGILVGLKDHGLCPTEVPEKKISDHPVIFESDHDSNFTLRKVERQVEGFFKLLLEGGWIPC